jgi:hypothetical protein
VRTLAIAACLLGLAARAQAQTAPASPASSAAERYEAGKKSAALAVTLEALSPIAGVGAFYAHDSDRGLTVAITSALAAGAAVGSAFWLVHLDHQQASGFDRTIQDAEQGTAISVLIGAGIVYLVARIAGVALASEATAAFNEDLREGLGLPAPEPVVPFHALAPGPMLSVRY